MFVTRSTKIANVWRSTAVDVGALVTVYSKSNVTSILIETQSQEEFVGRVKALPRRALDDHSLCDFHPLVTCFCGACESTDQIECKGFELDCLFHVLLYEIECLERASKVKEVIHPHLKWGHSNALEASHNVSILIDIYLERLHYHVSPNLAFLHANLTYMHAMFGNDYHWIPELYRCMKLPVFDGVREALEIHNMRRKRELERKKRRIELK